MKIKAHIVLKDGWTPQTVAALIQRGGLTKVNRSRLPSLGLLTAMMESTGLEALRALPGVASATADGEQRLPSSH